MEVNDYATVQDLLADASFRAWVSGEAADDQRDWEAWLNRHPEKQEIVRMAVLILEGMPFEFTERPVDPALVLAEWEKLRARTDRGASDLRAVRPKPAGKRPRPLLYTGFRVAASIALVVALSFLIREYVANPLIEHETPYGRQLSLVLPDSTQVELNAHSRLTYRKRNPRKVWLDGEAFFHVKKKPATGENFQVLTDDLTVEVLGTAFNVVETGESTEIVLEEGSVKLNLKRDFENEVFMQPGELVTFSVRSAAEVRKEKIEPASRTSWREGILQFEDVPLSRVMQRIENIYGYRSEYANEALRDRKISTPLPADDLESALTLLSRAIGINIEKVDEENLLILR